MTYVLVLSVKHKQYKRVILYENVIWEETWLYKNITDYKI